MYFEKEKIRYSDIAPTGRAGLISLLNFFQNVATGHTSGTKYEMHKLYALQRAWILISMNVEVYRYPEIDEEIIIYTYPQSYEKIYGTRCYKIESENGEVLAECSALWAFTDTEKRRVTKVFDDFGEIFHCIEDHNLPFLRKEPHMGDCEKVCDIKVGKRDIDTNLHVNNVKLVSFALEALPIDAEIKKAEIYYRNSVFEGENINVLSCMEGDTVGVKLVGEGEEKARTTIKFYLK